jgi:3,2-trans-enoyl-CoA isomerase
MSSIQVSRDEGIAAVAISRGRVNALNEAMVEEIDDCLQGLEKDEMVRSIILTGQGKFFSFGFDIPEFLSYSKDAFIVFLTKFTNLYTRVFLFPKPVVGALNGHAIAGGCMLAMACDYRLMISGKAKISLNEINFGSSVFAGCVEMLKFWVGQRKAQSVVYSGSMLLAEEALQLGLIHQISAEENLKDDATAVARDLAQKDRAAFASIKTLLRKPIAAEMIKRERDSVLEFADIWYSEKTWKNLQEIRIHS